MSKKIIYELDGNQWMARYDDFINLQESPAGFGDTHKEAKKNLREQMK